jgi:hypothetical protein
MKTGLAVGFALLVVGPASALDMDYPQQLKAINHCYVSHIRSDFKITDAMLFECMKQQGFAFCPNCQWAMGMLCKQGTGPDHADCYRQIRN